MEPGSYMLAFDAQSDAGATATQSTTITVR
jgi:hypothetical protein